MGFRGEGVGFSGLAIVIEATGNNNELKCKCAEYLKYWCIQ